MRSIYAACSSNRDTTSQPHTHTRTRTHAHSTRPRRLSFLLWVVPPKSASRARMQRKCSTTLQLFQPTKGWATRLLRSMHTTTVPPTTATGDIHGMPAGPMGRTLDSLMGCALPSRRLVPRAGSKAKATASRLPTNSMPTVSHPHLIQLFIHYSIDLDHAPYDLYGVKSIGLVSLVPFSGQSISITLRPFLSKWLASKILDLRCLLVPAPWVPGPKHVSNPE